MRWLLSLLLLIPSLCFADSQAENSFSGYTAAPHIIQSGGVSLRPRPYLDFKGMTCANTNTKTVCTSPSVDGTIYGWTRTGTNVYLTNVGDNVGIGTSTPDALLTVDGGSASNYAKIKLSAPSYDGIIKIYRWSGTGSLYAPYYFATGRGVNGDAFSFMGGVLANIGSESMVDRFTIAANGNVGIGTTAPVSPLEVNGLLTANGVYAKGTTTSQIISSDIGFVFNPVRRPSGFSFALAGAGAGNVNNGEHYYYLTYVTALGETELADTAGAESSNGYNETPAVTTAGNGKVNVNVTASTDPRVTGIRIYRSLTYPSGTTNYYVDIKAVDTISNVTQTYVDNVSDASRTGSASYTKENSTCKFMMTNNGALSNLPVSYFGASTVALGLNALQYKTSGGNNVAVGRDALNSLTTGSSNVALGQGANGYGVGTPYANISVGQWTNFQSSGQMNISIGHDAGFNLTSTSNNVLVGGYAGFSLNQDYNTYVGYSAGSATSKSGGNGVGIGAYAGDYETAGAKLFIDSIDRGNEADSRTKSLIYGKFDASVANQFLTVNGNLGIGTTAPTKMLSVADSCIQMKRPDATIVNCCVSNLNVWTCS